MYRRQIWLDIRIHNVFVVRRVAIRMLRESNKSKLNYQRSIQKSLNGLYAASVANIKAAYYLYERVSVVHVLFFFFFCWNSVLPESSRSPFTFPCSELASSTLVLLFSRDLRPLYLFLGLPRGLFPVGFPSGACHSLIVKHISSTQASMTFIMITLYLLCAFAMKLIENRVTDLNTIRTCTLLQR